MEQRCYSVPEQPPTLTPSPPLQRPAQRQNPHLHVGSADLRRDEEPDLQKHQSALRQTGSLSLSLLLHLRVSLSILCPLVRTVKRVFFCRSEDVSSHSWNPPPEVLRQRFHGDAPTLRTPAANAAALPGLTVLLLQERKKKKVLQLDRLKHT